MKSQIKLIIKVLEEKHRSVARNRIDYIHSNAEIEEEAGEEQDDYFTNFLEGKEYAYKDMIEALEEVIS